MHRFFVPTELTREQSIALPESEAHHAARVLRVQRGETVFVLDGAGAELQCEVADVSSKHVTLNVQARRQAKPRAFDVTLYLAIPKGKIIESIIQKATELGVLRVVPILSERVVTHLDAEGAETKGGKWQHIAVEAIKQCGNPWLPKVEPPARLADVLRSGIAEELSLVGCLEPGSRHPREWFRQFQHEHGRAPRTVSVWVGPEGDFTAAEYSAIQAAGARPITLGSLVLRVETAATYCLSVVNYEVSAKPT
jgi:16S rRNA (uracil1498-N3)-methyltransferase